MDNIVRVAFSGASRFARTIPVTRQDRGVWLLFENVDVPDTFQVHFSHTRANNGTAKTWMGTKENGVLIPDEYLTSGKTVYAWIFVQEDDSGMTKYMAEIPVYAKPTVTDDPPTPVQESAWDQAIEELNGVLDDAKAAASHYPMIHGGTWWLWDVEAQDYVNTGYAAAGRDGLDGLDGRDGRDGEKGDNGVTYTPVVDANGVISWTNDGNLPNPQPRDITGPPGKTGPKGDKGDKGDSLPSGGTDGQYLVKDSTAEGGARWADLPVFEPTAGTWSVTPLVEAETTLHTAGNYLDRDIVVEAIPYAEVSNPTGGMTATIGG